MMDRALVIKAATKKAAEEEVAKQKRLKAQSRRWNTLYTATLAEMRRLGPDILQNVEDISIVASKTPKVPRPKASPKVLKSTSIKLPEMDFSDISAASLKTYPIPPLPPIQKTTKQKVKKVEEPIYEIIEPSATISRGRRTRKRALFHDEMLINSLANQKGSRKQK